MPLLAATNMYRRIFKRSIATHIRTNSSTNSYHDQGVWSNITRGVTICHILLFLMFACSYCYNIWFNLKIKRSICLDYLYLTHWNLTFQVFFTFIEMISDILPTVAEYTMGFRSKFFYSVVFPFGFFVVIFFWILSCYDEELVRAPPEERSEEWYNQLVHTVILPVIFLELALVEHQLPTNSLESAMITVTVGILFGLWMTFFGVVFNQWTYQIFQNSSLSMLACYFVIFLTSLIIFHRIGIWFHWQFWEGKNHIK